MTISRSRSKIIDNAFDEGWAPAPHGQDRQDGRRGRLRACGSGRRPAADPRRPRGDRVRAGRPHRWSAALRHPRVQDGEAPIDRRLEQMRPRAPSSGRRQRRRRHHRRRSCSTEFDAVVLAGGATIGATCPSRPRTRRHPPGDGVPAARPTGAATAIRCRRPDQPRPARAAGVIIGGGDTGADCLGTSHRQARPACTSSRSCRDAAESGAD